MGVYDVTTLEFSEKVQGSLEKQFGEEISVWCRSPDEVPERMGIAEVGGLYIELTGETWEVVAAARDSVTEQLESMGLMWELDQQMEHRGQSDSSSSVVIATEAVTEDHIERSPW